MSLFLNLDNIKNEENNIKDFVSMFGEKIEKVKEDAISSFKSEYLKDKSINYQETKKSTKKIQTAKDAVSQLFK